MRKTITILGIGLRKQGVSPKTGRAYDFTPVSILHEDARKMEGQVGEIVNIETKVIEGIMLYPGMVCDAEIWEQNFRTLVGAIYER